MKKMINREHDVEHRRQVQRRFIVEMGFQRHRERKQRLGIGIRD